MPNAEYDPAEAQRIIDERDKYIARLEAVINSDAETEEDARTIARRVLSELDARGDSHGVPTIADVVESLVEAVVEARAIARKIKRGHRKDCPKVLIKGASNVFAPCTCGYDQAQKTVEEWG